MKLNAKKWTYGAVAPICLLLFILTGIPIGVIFYRALVYEGTLDIGQTIQTIMNPDNLQTITNTLLLGIAVVICSTVLALPLAFLTVRTKIAEKKMVRYRLADPIYDTTLYRIDGLDLIYATAGSLSANVSFYRRFFRKLFFVLGNRSDDEFSSFSFYFDDLKKCVIEYWD
ncbi:hypothetical protein DOK79_002828 [Enterococcus sp. DIV1094]|uniref:ABC transmembrane type-1 domain-containing protein n=1 Tax=Candidatus Enterococcus mangumiae TaxID=2230878 RepID=A0ABZ2T4N0_9ENTE